MEALITEMKSLSLSLLTQKNPFSFSTTLTLDQKNQIQSYHNWLAGCNTNTLISEAKIILCDYEPYSKICNLDKIKLTMILHNLGRNGFDISHKL